MNILSLVVKEILHRKLSFILGVVATSIATASIIGSIVLLRTHDLRTAAILEMKEERGTSIIKTKIPVAEMFGFNSALKSATGGTGFFWLIDIVYEPLPKELEDKVVNQIKQRKGIKDEPESED